MQTSSLYGTYARADLAFERGEGAWLYDEAGNAYLDFAAGIAVNSVGHSHPHLVEALKAQAEKLWHVSNIYGIPGQERLGRRLCEATFADRVFFTNSGAEALECAIKTARRCFYDRGEADRFEIITFEGAFHGRTLGTIAAGGNEKYLEGFGPKADGFTQIVHGDLDVVKKAVSARTAALLIEPIQGESGIRSADPTFLRGLRQIADEAGCLLIFDEVQTGVGRTGRLFAHELFGVEPDIMAVAKGIGGGFPLGACLARESVAAGMVPGTHGSTYGGNPLAAAAGNAVLDIVLEDGFLDEVARKGLLLKQKIAALVDQHGDIFELVRGEGLMLGLKCKPPVGDVLAAVRERKFLAAAAGDNVLRLLPPLVITEEDMDAAIERLSAAASDLEAKLKTKTTEGQAS
ncbi:aspartate aminotransferase family protein [Coralliovum pocilloporae]|uniref:aspartate aminotransferase family protein n=1 Tax=Coralliovum pocilloporae TaxID=3066369 RepID=UPI0033071FCE